MSRHVIPFLLGAALGVAGALAAGSLLENGREAPAPGRAAELEAEKRDLARQNDELRSEVARLKEEAISRPERDVPVRGGPAPGDPDAPEPGDPVPVEPAEEPGAAGPPSMDDLVKAVQSFAPALGQVIQGGGDEAKERLRELFARADPAQIAELAEEYEKTSDIGRKVVLAHALAQSGRPEALEALTAVLADRNRPFDDRRYVAHGLAFSGVESVDPALRVAAREDPDRGTRANAAFGLARKGDDEGLRLYAAATDEAFRESDPVALQYLTGYFLLGEKGLPFVRERLDTYEERQTRLMLIEVLKSEKDREALPALHRLGNDASVDSAVSAAARKAIEVIEGSE